MHGSKGEGLRDRTQAVAQEVLTSFQEGTVPKALAQIFIHHQVEVPSMHWTWSNRLLCILRGHVYAAGFRQWEELGRHVKRGQQAFHILAPRVVKAKEENPESGLEESCKRVVGFLCIPVFGYLQTEGDSLPGADDEPQFIDSLPLIEVAKSWGLSVATFSFSDTQRTLGLYAPGLGIALGVKNLSTWAHELVHAADHRLGTRGSSELDREVVAELGGAVLLECLGYSVESDRGGAHEYITAYCKNERASVIGTCTALLDRVCGCVSFLLSEALTLEKGDEDAA